MKKCLNLLLCLFLLSACGKHVLYYPDAVPLEAEVSAQEKNPIPNLPTSQCPRFR